MSEDPYRTAAIIETREQRIERTRRVYWAMAAVNVANRTPEDLAAIERGFQRAAAAYQRALDSK